MNSKYLSPPVAPAGTVRHGRPKEDGRPVLGRRWLGASNAVNELPEAALQPAALGCALFDENSLRSWPLALLDRRQSLARQDGEDLVEILPELIIENQQTGSTRITGSYQL
jgi:hypothetical protein